MPVVLIVEDDPALANLYDQIFKRDGFSTLIARDGEAGLEIATNKKPDIILSDVKLPKMSGIDMLAKLVATPHGKDIPVVFLTGNDPGGEEKDRAMSLGAKDYLPKGVDEPEEIVNKVKKYLGIIQS